MSAPVLPRAPEGNIGKRKRDETSASPDSGSDSNTPSEASAKKRGGLDDKSKPNRASKARGKKIREKEPVECLHEWPDWFKTLDRTHRALNLVFTFCSTRKHLTTTFDTIRSTVMSHTKRDLLVEDVAALVALCPDGIRFAYVDEKMLRIDVRGAEKDDVFKRGYSSKGRSQGFAPDASVGGYTGAEELGSLHPDDIAMSGREVLYFEFIGEDLKRQVPCEKTGEPKNPTKKLREERLRMPVFSQKQMTNLMEKRNLKFTNAVNSFLNECIAENVDPEMALRSRAEAYIPQPSTPHWGM